MRRHVEKRGSNKKKKAERAVIFKSVIKLSTFNHISHQVGLLVLITYPNQWKSAVNAKT